MNLIRLKTTEDEAQQWSLSMHPGQTSSSSGTPLPAHSTPAGQPTTANTMPVASSSAGYSTSAPVVTSRPESGQIAALWPSIRRQTPVVPTPFVTGDDDLRPGPASTMSFLSQNSQGDTELTLAAASGDLEAMQRLLAAGADNTHRNAKGHCALVRAARQGHAEAIELLTKGYPAARERLALALAWAASRGHSAAVMALVNAGADTNQASPAGDTALMLAVAMGHAVTVGLLLTLSAHDKSFLKVTAPPDNAASFLCAAAQNGAQDFAILLSPAYLDCVDASGRTALIIAAQSGAYDIVELMMRRGARIDAANLKGHTALYLAAVHGHFGIVEKLLRAGASTDGIIDALSGTRPNAEQASSGSSSARKTSLDDDIVADLLHFQVHLLVSGAAMPTLAVSADALMAWLANFGGAGAPGWQAEISSKGVARFLIAHIGQASESRGACWKALAYTEFDNATPAQKHACCAIMLSSLKELALGKDAKDTLLSSRLSPDTVQRYSRLLKRQMLSLISAARRSEHLLLLKMMDLRQMHKHAFPDPDAYYSPVMLNDHLTSCGIAGLLAERIVAAYTSIFTTYEDTLRPAGLPAFARKLRELLGSHKFARAMHAAFARHDHDPMVVRLLSRQIDMLKLAYQMPGECR